MKTMININDHLTVYNYTKVRWLIGLLIKNEKTILSCTQLKFDQHTIHATINLGIVVKNMSLQL